MLAQYQQAIESHRQRVYSYAYYSLRVKDDADDVTQDVFIKLWQNWQKIDHSKLGGWLMRVARNAVVDHVRKQKPAQDNLDSYADVDSAVGAGNTEASLDQEYFKAQLQQAIKSLDDPFRSIIVMRDIQGLSYSDIQESLDMSQSQVKVYLHRGRRKLRENISLRKIFDENLAGRSSKAKNSSSGDATSSQDMGTKNV